MTLEEVVTIHRPQGTLESRQSGSLKEGRTGAGQPLAELGEAGQADLPLSSSHLLSPSFPGQAERECGTGGEQPLSGSLVFSGLGTARGPVARG